MPNNETRHLARSLSGYLVSKKRHAPATNENTPDATIVRPALYYPYIHVRSEHWLKATLLCTPTVKRIVPDTYAPEDTPGIHQYTEITGPHGTLLQAVPPYTTAAMQAQEQLRQQLDEHRTAIKRAYAKGKAIAAKPYYIHSAKFTNDLLDWLTRHNLAWPDHHPNAYGDREWYALHPTLGKAIMTTLGLSIAEEQHYDIVTADGTFHEALLAAAEDEIFDAVLKGTTRRPATHTQARQDLAQRVIMLTGINYEALQAEDIPELQASTHFQGFQRILRHSASAIELDTPTESYTAQIREEADEIISAWHDVKSSVGKALKDALFDASLMLGAEALKAITKVPDRMTVAVAGGILVVKSTTKVIDAQKKRRNSPYQYLTQIVNAQRQFTKLVLPLGLER